MRRVIAAGLLALGGLLLALPVFAEAPLVTERAGAPSAWQLPADWPQARYAAFSTLARDASPRAPETGRPRKLAQPIQGDAARGRALAFAPMGGTSCVSCHVMGGGGHARAGNVGPDLSRIGAVGRDDEWLYNFVYDARVFSADTLMPPWGAHRMFTEADTRDVVAFLKTLNSAAVFAQAEDDPDWRKSAAPDTSAVEAALAEGRAAFERPGPNGRSCAACHREPERAFKTWAAAMPIHEPRLGRVLGIEEFIARHAPATTEAELPMRSAANVALALHLRALAAGAPLRSDPAAGARAAAERGKALTGLKIGRLNFACMDCHAEGKGAGKWFGAVILPPAHDLIARFSGVPATGGLAWGFRERLQWCNLSAGADPVAPDARQYGDIEIYLATLGAGRPLAAPGARR